MTNPAKQLISYDDLLKKIQFLLISYPECHDISINEIEVIPEQVDGANWRAINYLPSGDDNNLPGCRDKIRKDVADLREYYEVVIEFKL
jgi:hypothetical protein